MKHPVPLTFIQDLPAMSKTVRRVFLIMCVLVMTACSFSKHGHKTPSAASPDNFKDAVPKVEPLLSGPNKPYTVRGKRYVPDTREIPYRHQGIASWYGKQFHGKSTSSGEKFNMYVMSAAHNTLPIPSYAHVTNTKNNRSVIVRINDRGPFSDKRIIDLSYAAAYRLGMVEQGTAAVIVERILPADIRAGRIPATSGNSSKPTPTPAPTPSPVPQNNTLSGGFYLQIGVYSQQANAQNIQNQLSSQNPDLRSRLRTLYNSGLYKVYAGPYPTRQQAQEAGDQIQYRNNINVLILDRN